MALLIVGSVLGLITGIASGFFTGSILIALLTYSLVGSLGVLGAAAFVALRGGARQPRRLNHNTTVPAE